MIRPVLMNDKFLEDVRAASAEPDQLHLWWLGQSGFLLHWQGSHVLLDPYLSDSLTRKYAATNTPHVRMTERLVAPEKLDFIDIVTSSHNHTDHLDGETLGALLGANPGLAILVSEANQEFAAQRLQLPADRLTGIPTDRAVKVNELTFTALPSAHEELETDTSGSWRYIGLVIQAGPLTLYHSGDTVRYPGLQRTAAPVSHRPRAAADQRMRPQAGCCRQPLRDRSCPAGTRQPDQAGHPLPL